MTDQPATSVGPPLDAVKNFGITLGGTQGFFQGDNFVALGQGAQPDNEPIFRSCVAPDGVVSFLYEIVDGNPDDIVGDPTAVLVKDGLIIAAFALSDAIRHDDPDMVAVAAAMGDGERDPLLDPIPTPGADDWRVILCDPAKRHTFKALADRVGVAVGGSVVVQAEGFGTLNAATLLTPGFTLEDPLYGQPMTVSVGGHYESKNWKNDTAPIRRLLEGLSKHPENKKKDGSAFVLGEIIGPLRRKPAVKACYGVGLDVDGGVDGAVIDAAMVKSGLLGVRYTTHSHAKTTSTLLKKNVIGFARKNDLGAVCQDVVVQYLRAETRWEESIIASVEYAGDTHEAEGQMVELHHLPMPKHRVVLFLERPFEPAQIEGLDHPEGMKLWGKVIYATAALLGLEDKFDRACIDPSRLFYFPRHVPGRPHETTIAGGKLLDWKSLDLAGDNEAEPMSDDPAIQALLDDVRATEKAKPRSKSTTEQGRDLGHWSKTNGHAGRFQVADLIEDHADDRIRGRKGQLIEIECPFDENHTDAGNPEDTACIAVNAGDGDAPIFTLKCQHDSCSQRTNLDHLGKMLKDGWFDQAALDNPTYYSLPDDDAEPVVVQGASAGPIALDEVQALTVESTQEDVEAVVARIARLPKFQQGGRIKALVKATGMSTPDARAMIKDAAAEAVAPLPKPAANLAPILAQIPLPSAAHGDFKIAAFDGKPWVYESKDDEKGAGRRLYTPWGVAGGAVYMDRDERVGLRLAVLNRSSRLTEIDAPYGLIADSKAFRAELISRGVSMTTAGGERAADLVAQYQPDNPLEIYDRPGWRKPGMFLSAWGEVITADADAEPTIGLSRSSMPKGAARAGTLEGWIAATKAAFDLGLIQLQLSGLAAFASPIIDLCKYESRTLFFSGSAGRGKSTGHLIQTSAWGDPKPKAGLFGTFSTTINAPEVVLQQGSGCGVAFDEVKSLRGGNLQTFLFDVWSGVGRSRMDYRSAGLKDTNSWHLLFTASYEDPLASKIKGDGDQVMPGLGARVLEVTVNGTEVRTDLIPAVEAVKTNFGWSGPAFVRALFDQGWVDDPEGLKAEIAEKAERLKAFQRSDQPRSATTAAILWQAGEIAIEAGLLPDVFPMMPADDIVMKLDENLVTFDDAENEDLINAESDLERLMLTTWRNATLADSAATDTLTKAVNTLIRNLVTSIGASVADGSDGHTNRERLAFRLDGFQPVGAGTAKRVYVIPIDSVAKLAEAPVEYLKIAKALEARGMLVLYPRAPTSDGRIRKAERRWPRVPGLGEVPAIIIDASAIE